MIKIVDVVTDEKFIDSLIKLNDSINHDALHVYVRVYGRSLPQFKYVTQSARIQLVEIKDFISFLKSNEADAVFLHSLFSLPLEIIPQIPKSLPVFWMGWGMDIYNKYMVDIPLYHALTKKVVDSPFQQFSFKLKMALRMLKRGNIYSHCYHKAVARIDYFSGVLPLEYDLLVPYPFFHAKRFSYSYNDISDLNNKNLKMSFSKGDNVMIGNSGAPSNNHLDLFHLLNKTDSPNRKYYSVLSYGATDKYIKKVISTGSALWGTRFIPILKFMNRETFFNLYSDCGYCVYLHERQQGIGNVEYALRSGKKVFVSENSTTYKYYKSIGCYIYSTQSDLSTTSLNTPLSEEEQLNNFNIVNSLYTIDTETQKMNDIVYLVNQWKVNSGDYEK